VILPKSSHWKAYARPFLGDARQPEVRTFPLFILIETICPKISGNPMTQNSRCALPVDARRSKTYLLIKLIIIVINKV